MPDVNGRHKRYSNTEAASARRVDYEAQLEIIKPSLSHRTRGTEQRGDRDCPSVLQNECVAFRQRGRREAEYMTSILVQRTIMLLRHDDETTESHSP